MSSIQELLRERVGLDAASIGANVLERAVRLQRKRLKVETAEQHCQLLVHSPAAWRELVESVMVTETWFFRDREAFTALARLVRDEWLPAHPGQSLRLLSLPCSSGEEPFSIAMALLEAGVPAECFTVDAADLSSRALAQAKLGVYGKNSFRGEDLAFRRRYFHETKLGFKLDPLVRSRARFSQMNVLLDALPFGTGVYDFIFCRNLLIYLEATAQEKVLARICRMLAPAGLLFVGPAELPLVIKHGFLSARLLKAFACHKPAMHPAHLDPHTEASFPANNARAELPASSDFPSPAAESAALRRAEELANSGFLAEAAGICEAHLRQNGPSAQAYYLLGLVRDARGESQAADCYRKALYLDPHHQEALLQMALLAQKNGDVSGAQNFRRRAQRAKVPLN